MKIHESIASRTPEWREYKIQEFEDTLKYYGWELLHLKDEKIRVNCMRLPEYQFQVKDCLIMTKKCHNVFGSSEQAHNFESVCIVINKNTLRIFILGIFYLYNNNHNAQHFEGIAFTGTPTYIISDGDLKALLYCFGIEDRENIYK